MNLPRYLGVAVFLFVSAPLVWFGVNPLYYAEIFLTPMSGAVTCLQAFSSFTGLDSNGVAFFDFRARVDGRDGERLYLEIRPQAESHFYPQANGILVRDGLAVGVGQLGSPQYPLHQDERYYFRVVDDNNKEYVSGKIVAVVHTISSGNSQVILAIGILASIIQLATFAQSFRASRTAGAQEDSEASRS